MTSRTCSPHISSGRHRRGDGPRRGLHVDDVARAHAERRLMTDAYDPEALPVDSRNKAHDSAGADVESRNDAISCLSHGVPRFLTRTLERFYSFASRRSGRRICRALSQVELVWQSQVDDAEFTR